MKRKSTYFRPVPPPAAPAPKPTAAGLALSPELAAAVSMNLMVGPEFKGAGVDLPAVMRQLHAEGQAVASGDLEQVRRTLASQVAMLNQMFHTLFQLAYSGSLSHDLVERYLRLALKAQSQSAHTMHVLAKLSPGTPHQEPAAQPKATPASTIETAPQPPPHAPRRIVVPIPPLKLNVDEHGNRRPAGAGSALHGLSAPVGR